MKMDRNINADGMGKYALLSLRKLRAGRLRNLEDIGAAAYMNTDAIETGGIGTEGEFFVIKLRDRHARVALLAYADAAAASDPEWASEVREMADRAGECSPFCKTPD